MNPSQMLTERLRQLTYNVEVFLAESPHNNYKPKPPEGFFAMRSRNRRIFMPLLNGRIPPPDLVQERIKLGEYHVA